MKPTPTVGVASKAIYHLQSSEVFKWPLDIVYMTKRLRDTTWGLAQTMSYSFNAYFRCVQHLFCTMPVTHVMRRGYSIGTSSSPLCLYLSDLQRGDGTLRGKPDKLVGYK